MNDLPEFDLPPHDLLSERRLLAAMLRHPQDYDDITGIVGVEEFYYAPNKMIFESITSLYRQNLPLDVMTVFTHLKQQNQIDSIGGAAYLGDIMDSDPTGAYWQHAAKIVSESAIRRRVIHTCQEMLRDARDTKMPVAELTAQFEHEIFKAGESGRRQDQPTDIAEARWEVIDELDRRSRGEGTKPITTGFVSLDAVIGGWRNGELTVIAARPGVGKTSFALNSASRGVEFPDSSILFFSQEMHKNELAQREMSFSAQVPLHAIRGLRPLKAHEDEPGRLTAAASRTTPSRLWLDHRSSLSAGQIASRVREWQRKHGIKVVFIDYLQRMKHDAKLGNYSRQVGETAKELKTLARDCQIPVVCLAQLNREGASRADPRPRMSDLRDSGEIEQEADNIILLHPEEMPVGVTDRQDITLIIEKQRNGPCIDVRLEHIRKFTRFEESMPGGI